MQGDLQDKILPELDNPEARFSAMMISQLLSYLTMWDGLENEFLPDHLAKMKSLIELSNTKETVTGANPGHLNKDGQSLISEFSGSSQDYVEASLKMEEVITQGLAGNPSIENSVQITGLGLAALRLDQTLFVHEQQAMSMENSAIAELRSTMETELTPAIVSSYLLQHLPEVMNSDDSVAVNRVPGGFSKDTHIISIQSKSGEQSQALVSRRDLPFGPGENTVVDEYDLLKSLHKSGFPVAQPLVCERSHDHFGQPFMISRKVPGASGTDEWGGDTQLQEAIGQDLARILARLHSEDPSKHGFEISTSPTTELRVYIETWHDRWLRRRDARLINSGCRLRVVTRKPIPMTRFRVSPFVTVTLDSTTSWWTVRIHHRLCWIGSSRIQVMPWKIFATAVA